MKTGGNLIVTNSSVFGKFNKAADLRIQDQKIKNSFSDSIVNGSQK